jgi:50S ribosomal subunit-associated GTPase HflX
MNVIVEDVSYLNSENAKEVERKLMVIPPRNMKVGLVGLSNVGKTAVFNLLTSSNAPTDSSVFSTIGLFITNYRTIL